MGINLVPQKVYIRRRGKRRSTLIAQILLIVIVTSPLCICIMAGSYSNSSENVPTPGDQSLVRGIAHQVNLLHKDIDRLLQEEQHAIQYEGRRRELVYFLSSLARNRPRDITFTTITYTARENSFVGVAKDQESLLHFFQTLAQRSFLGVPNIRRTSWKSIDGLMVLEFEVTMTRDVVG